MVQAFRSQTKNRSDIGANEIAVSGTYSLEQKITVEWERAVETAALVDVARRLPGRLYSRDEIRFFLSGWFRTLDPDLPDTKISEYRISSRSLKEILGILEDHDALQQRGNEEDGTWEPIKKS